MRSAGARTAAALRNRAGAAGAVVIGGDYQGLGIARSLGRRGIDVLVVDDERSIARHSRFVRAAVRVPELRDERATVQTLLELGERHGLDGWVLFPTREETVAALSRYRERLTPQFRVPTPAWDVVEWAWDKRKTYEIAAELGIATPRTWLVGSAEELDAIDGEPPFAVKPAIKERFLYATGDKAWRADTRTELEQRFRAAAELVGAGEVIVQELIPGAGETQLAYCAFFRDGRASASMVVRRLRQHPPLFGRASTFVQTIEDPALEEVSERLLRRIGYYGLVELEYKHDVRDGQRKLLDINARTWGYHSLGQRAGVDFPWLLYADQMSLPAPDGLRAPPGVSWIRLATDVPTAAALFAQGALDWRAYLGSLRAANVESVFSRDDPLPGVAELALLPYLAVKRGF
ncbi:MAG: ATP-grasp domain-containing protein [Solirubrobacteraceae bacterium]